MLASNISLAQQKPRASRLGEVQRNSTLWMEMSVGLHLLNGKKGNFSQTTFQSITGEQIGSTYPANYNWGNKDGVNYLTPVRNQHIPVYCGSCWAHGPTSALADRWNIVSQKMGHGLPHLMLSVQNVLSCGNDKTRCGTCNGGDDAPVYLYAKHHGIPHESCSNYMAVDTTCQDSRPVTDLNKPSCYTCWPDNRGCNFISKYDKLFISEFGTSSGYDMMKQEIFNRGPVSCGIAATDKMENYTAGIFSEEGEHMIDHLISVVGWGQDEATNDEYWIVRNSWGVAWGEHGYMRIVTSRNQGPAGTGNNRVEDECAFGVVDRFAEV